MKLKRVGCSLSLRGFDLICRDRLLIDLDLYFFKRTESMRMCDYIVFAEFEDKQSSMKLLVFPVEVTKKRFTMSKIRPQLEGGARVAERAIKVCWEEVGRRYSGVLFRPIAVARGVRGIERASVERQSIAFSVKGIQEREVIRIGQCNDTLVKICGIKA